MDHQSLRRVASKNCAVAGSNFVSGPDDNRSMDEMPRIDFYADRRAECPLRLEDFVESRQKTWMWRYLQGWSRGDISDFVVALAAEQSQCLSQWTAGKRNSASRRGLPMARLGDDGLYHLVSHKGIWCGGKWAPVDVEPEMAHALDPLDRVPKEWGDGRTDAWRVTLWNDAIGPESVPYRRRCPLPPRFGTWPAYSDGCAPQMRTRRMLIDTFGRACAICGVAPGVFVDHDHFSGLVRGFLCVDCNSRVDWCPHLRGCLFADYLNDPPAFSMALQYRGKLRDFEDKTTAAAIGVDSIRKTPAASEWLWHAPRSPFTLHESRRPDAIRPHIGAIRAT